MNQSFEVMTTDTASLIVGFEKQGFSVSQIAPDRLQVSGRDWNNVIVHVKTPRPGSIEAGVISVGTNGGIPPFGFWTLGMAAATA
jgi:hypothetical protein